MSKSFLCSGFGVQCESLPAFKARREGQLVLYRPRDMLLSARSKERETRETNEDEICTGVNRIRLLSVTLSFVVVFDNVTIRWLFSVHIGLRFGCVERERSKVFDSRYFCRITFVISGANG